MHKALREDMQPQAALPDKLFYKIGEAGKLVGVEPYVLRYWETEFSFLKPRKNKSGQRVYVKKDLEILLQIKKMLYQDRLTIEGVRKKFGEDQLKTPERRLIHAKRVVEPSKPADVIEHVKKRLREIIRQIE
jgi:DNA-binding transcriptional MerR regulator